YGRAVSPIGRNACAAVERGVAVGGARRARARTTIADAGTFGSLRGSPAAQPRVVGRPLRKLLPVVRVPVSEESERGLSACALGLPSAIERASERRSLSVRSWHHC